MYHNGAFMLAHRFSFYQGFKLRQGDPAPPPAQAPPRFDYGTPDGYDFYLSMGSLANADEKYFKHTQPLWLFNLDHATYDEAWQSRAIWRHLKGIKPAVMLVGGWYDTEDPQGLLRQFDFMEKNTPPSTLMLVMGPWNHGGFSRGDGDRLGNVDFGSKTGLYYRQNIEFPFFMYYLKGKGDGKFPKAYLFQTGVNQWRKFNDWPPRAAASKAIYLDDKGKLSWQQPATAGFDEYLSDPNKPVPYIGLVAQGVLNSYMTEDQRFAATRPDVLVYKTEPLDHDLTASGPISVDLKVSTTGTDSDFVVKVIDVYPGDYPTARRGSGCRRRTRQSACEYRADGRVSRVDPRRTVSRKIPQELRKAGAIRAGKTGSHHVPPARCGAYLAAGSSHHGADPKLMVSADGSESAEVHGYSEGALERFREGDRAGLFRRRGRIED